MKICAPLVALLFTAASLRAQVMVTIDTNTSYQTIQGWGHGSANLGCGWSPIDSVNYDYVDFLADDWGLTGTRINEIGVRLDGTGIDHGDCDSVDWSLFQAGPAIYRDYMVHFRDRVLAQGFAPSFYSSTNYASLSTNQKPWVQSHPGERAQQIWANAQYWHDHHGLDMNYAVVINEPTAPWTAQVIADVIKALAPRCAERGLITKAQFPECVAPQTSWQYITAVRNDTDLWRNVGRVSYHDYGTEDPYRSYIRAFGDSIGLPTAQTERDPANIDNLFDDLVKGGVSYWEVAYTGGSTVNGNAGYTSFSPTRYYYRVRQLLHYVRPGGVRKGAIVSDSLVRVLPFKRNDALTTVVYNTASQTRTVTVEGIPAGRYGVSIAAPSVIAFQELGIRTIGDDHATTVTVPAGNALTIYPYAGSNLPPTVETWGSTPGVLHAPTSTAQLYITANDPERDSLTYHWSLVSQPAGASAAIANQQSATATASGLTVEGTYVFGVVVGDGAATVSKKVYLIVYTHNQPPTLGFTGFRLASPYGVVLDAPNPGGKPLHTTITLPTSTSILQANISDLENDPITGLWTIVSQPPGGVAVLDTMTYIYASIRTIVTKMTVPGDYVFQVEIHDTANPPSRCQVICTVLPTNVPPVIATIQATPPTVVFPVHASELSATTTDANNDLLRHWWVVKSAPAGARPLFDHQGRSTTTVSNLMVPGKYTFTLRTFDDISMTTRDVSVQVNDASGIDARGSAMPADDVMDVSPNPATTGSHVCIDVHAGAIVRGEIIDMLGRTVAILPEGYNGMMEWSPESVAEGVYFVRAVAQGREWRRAILLTR